MAGVSTSLQNIKDIISDCQFDLCNTTIKESLSRIQDEAKHMTVMNIFMFESINRLLDCAKIQKGMKLVPKKESISITESLSLPISCLKTIQ